MDELGGARWWSVRAAQNRKPATYRCPLCGRQLPALRPHMLLLPEGMGAGRRHAHTECVVAARGAGKLPTRAEWHRTQGQHGSPGVRRARWGHRILALLRGVRR